MIKKVYIVSIRRNGEDRFISGVFSSEAAALAIVKKLEKRTDEDWDVNDYTLDTSPDYLDEE